MTVGLDADDTLWINEKYFHEVEEEVMKLVEPYYGGTDLYGEMFKTEMSNLELFGYGAKGFILSLIETAVRVTDGGIPGSSVGRIVSLGKELIKKPVVLRGGVHEALEALGRNGHELVLLTKGDLLDQMRKLDKSGLREFFSHVEVMRGKTEDDYRQFFAKLSISPDSFVMVGDSLKSDVIPVLAAGGWAVHLRGGTTWAHETFDGDIENERFFKADKLGEVVSMVEKISEKKKAAVSADNDSGVSIHTDGGCLGNPGPGGWACIISSGTEEIRRSGGERDTTNNRMELTAVIESLKYVIEEGLDSKAPVTLYTDSQYVRNGITKWIHNWERNGWKTAAKKPVKNRDLWMELKSLSDRLEIKWEWVKGHSGNPLNEACDALVKEEMTRITGKEG